MEANTIFKILFVFQLMESYEALHFKIQITLFSSFFNTKERKEKNQ